MVDLELSLFLFEDRDRIIKLAIVLQHWSDIIDIAQSNRYTYDKHRFFQTETGGVYSYCNLTYTSLDYETADGLNR